MILDLCVVGAEICRSVFVYVADRPCCVSGAMPKMLECKSSSWKTNASRVMCVLGIDSIAMCDWEDLVIVSDVESWWGSVVGVGSVVREYV